MTVGAVAGTKLFIGTTETTPSPDDWVEIKNIGNLGNLMTQFAKIAVESVGDGYTRQIKGTQSVTPMDLVFNRDDTDPGQIAAKAAAADRNAFYWFKIEENDIGSGAHPTTSTFKGRLYGAGSAYGGVNDLKKVNTSLEVEPDSIVVVAAA